MFHCDLNCDLGEGIGNDEAIMPFITSANIACSFHAGDESTMTKTVELCKEFNVHIGAHPSFSDRENFGRKVINLTADEVYKITKEQVELLQSISAAHQTRVHHVKPHGALYNVAARNRETAMAIAHAVKDCDEHLILYGLSGSYLIAVAEAIGLKTKSEVFADRSYQDDGSLTPRSQSNALIEDEELAVRQVIQMVNESSVTSVSGKIIPITADTICIHGDGKNAIVFARRLHKLLFKY